MVKRTRRDKREEGRKKKVKMRGEGDEKMDNKEKEKIGKKKEGGKRKLKIVL